MNKNITPEEKAEAIVRHWLDCFSDPDDLVVSISKALAEYEIREVSLLDDLEYAAKMANEANGRTVMDDEIINQIVITASEAKDRLPTRTKQLLELKEAAIGIGYSDPVRDVEVLAEAFGFVIPASIEKLKAAVTPFIKILGKDK